MNQFIALLDEIDRLWGIYPEPPDVIPQEPQEQPGQHQRDLAPFLPDD